MGNTRGFSLMELMAVVAVIGIMTAIAIPNLIGNKEVSRARGAAADIAGAIQRAKMEAVKRNKRVVMIFNSLTDSYIAFVDLCGNAWALDACDETIIQETVGGQIDLYTTLTSGTFAMGPRGFPEGLPTNFPAETAENKRPAIFLKANDSRYFRVCITLSGSVSSQTSTNGDNWD